MKSHLTNLSLCIFSSATLLAASEANRTELLDSDLSRWDRWLGVPHSSVEGLPEETFKSGDVHSGKPLGLNNDPKSVFSTMQVGDETWLHVSGEIFGGLVSKESYQNYHLQLQFKWGEKKWEPRLNDKRDSGIIYHSRGEHGAFWKVWKAGLEYQVQEKDMGDFIPLAGPTAQFRLHTDGKREVFDLDSEYTTAKGYTHCLLEPDFPIGEWNTLDLYVFEDSAIHVVNGVVVMAIKHAVDATGNPLISGQIQLQSEAAECYYKNIRITPIESLPEDLMVEARFE